MSSLSFQSLLYSTGFHHTNNYDINFIFSAKNTKLISKFALGLMNPLTVSRKLSDCCYQVNPNLGSIDCTQILTYGEKFNIPYSKSYPQLTMGFYLDADGEVYSIFNEWMETIYDSKTRTMGYMDDYSVDIEVIFSKNGEGFGSSLNLPFLFGRNDFMKITFERAYPTQISAISLNGSVQNTVSQFDVSFNYRRAIFERM